MRRRLVKKKVINQAKTPINPVAKFDAHPVPVVQEPFSVDGQWFKIQLPVTNLERAWTCALDVEGWLNILTAGLGGPVVHLAGMKREVGLSYLNSYTLCADMQMLVSSIKSIL